MSGSIVEIDTDRFIGNLGKEDEDETSITYY